MTKSSVAKLFVVGVIVVVIGQVLEIVAVLSALANGVITFGGAYLIQFNGWTISPLLITMAVLGGLAIFAGTLISLIAWVGALLNTFQLEDKTWFVLLLVLGVMSFGFLAMVAYVLAGPDSTRPRPLSVPPAIQPTT